MKHGSSSSKGEDDVDDDAEDDVIFVKVEQNSNSTSMSEDAKPALDDSQVQNVELCDLL